MEMRRRLVAMLLAASVIWAFGLQAPARASSAVNSVCGAGGAASVQAELEEALQELGSAVKVTGGLLFENRENLTKWLESTHPYLAKQALAGLDSHATVYLVVPRSVLTEGLPRTQLDMTGVERALDNGGAVLLPGMGDQSDEDYVILSLTFCALCLEFVIAVVGSILVSIFIDAHYTYDVVFGEEGSCPYCYYQFWFDTTHREGECSYCGAEGRLFVLFSCDDYVRLGCNTCGGEIWVFNPY